MWYKINKCPACGYPGAVYFPQYGRCRVCMPKHQYTHVTDKPVFKRPQLMEDEYNEQP